MTMNTRPSSVLGWSVRSSLSAAAVAAAMVVASGSVARAQYRVGADGHVNDVNNRLGSGGYNSSTDASYRSSLNNQISTGNVSGLDYFHGRVGSFDPNTLQVNTQDGAVQQLTQYSAPVNYAHPTNGQSIYTPYYNTAQYNTAPPQTFTPTKNNGVGIVEAPAVSPLTPTSDVRLQNLNAPVDATSILPPVTTADGPGPVNPNGAPSLYAMSSLYGIRQLEPGDLSGTSQAYTDRYGVTPRTLGTAPNSQNVQRMRAELNGSVSNDPADGSVSNNPGGSGLPSSPAANSLGGGPGSTGDQPTGLTVQNQPFNASVKNQQVTAPVGAPLSSVTQTLNVPAGKQSQQLSDLQKRFAAATPHPTAAQRTDQLNQERLALRKASSAKPGVAGATPPAAAGDAAGRLNFGDGKMPAGTAGKGSGQATPQTAKGPLQPIARTPEPAPVDASAIDKPYVITSLAAGIRAPGLADTLKQAEDAMRDGKFSEAVDKYDLAGEVAPNNPFVPLGRSFAELGANFYGKAEADLTKAIVAEPAVLAGQYDLKGFLGETRLRFVQNDLADIAKTEQTSRPHLLLAYIAHNSAAAADATVTARELDAAAARGGDQRVIDLMRQAWNLPAAAK